MPRVISGAEAVSLFRPGINIYIPGISGEATVIIDALRQDPARADGVTFFGGWVPGVNRTDYAAFHDRARAIGFFVAPEYHKSFQAGRYQFHPLPYSRIYSFLAEELACDIAFFHLSLPDDRGLCSCGVAADFAPALWRKAKIKIGILNSAMPHTNSPNISYEALDYVVETGSPLIEYAKARLDPTSRDIAANVAAHIRDGDTLQIGIGTLPRAVLAGLKDRRNLKLHTGMITDGVDDLIDAGAISADPFAIRTGTALGSRDFYARIGAEPSVSFHPVPFTHGFGELARIERFVAINSAVSVDLFGQLNVEMMNGRQVSGIGGITDFIRGASASVGGRAIIAMPSITGGGISRVVAAHPPGTVIGSSRADPVILVTEFGTADLRGLSVDAQAESVISIAHPRFRAELTDTWRELRGRM